MELTKKALDEVKFRTRGRWYSAEQVDAFIDELAVSADSAEQDRQMLNRKVEELAEKIESLREENVRLWQQTQQLRAEVQAAPKCDPNKDLKAEREQLLSDIKALRKFRQSFYEAVEKDAASIKEQLAELSSYKLL